MSVNIGDERLRIMAAQQAHTESLRAAARAYQTNVHEPALRALEALCVSQHGDHAWIDWGDDFKLCQRCGVST